SGLFDSSADCQQNGRPRDHRLRGPRSGRREAQEAMKSGWDAVGVWIATLPESWKRGLLIVLVTTFVALDVWMMLSVTLKAWTEAVKAYMQFQDWKSARRAKQ